MSCVAAIVPLPCVRRSGSPDGILRLKRRRRNLCTTHEETEFASNRGVCDHSSTRSLPRRAGPLRDAIETVFTYDLIMNAVWLGVGIAIGTVVVGVAVALRWSGGRQSADVDVGSVSEGWLAEQRGRKDS